MKKKTKIGLTSFALAVAGGIGWSFHSSTDDKSIQNAPPSAPLNIWAALPASEVTISPQPNHSTSVTSTLNHVAQKIKSDTECVGDMFYHRSQSAQKANDKFSNLRWAVEAFMKNSPTNADAFKKAADNFGMDKSKLISEIRTAAINVFKDSTSGLHTNLDWMRHWNQFRIAHQYAGLTDEGEFNTSLSVANVGYSYNDIIKERDIYLVNAAIETVPRVLAFIQSINPNAPRKPDENGVLMNPLHQALVALPLQQKIQLLDDADLISYVVRTTFSEVEAPYTHIGLTADQYSAILKLRPEYLGSLIREHSLKECQLAPQSP